MSYIRLNQNGTTRNGGLDTRIGAFTNLLELPNHILSGVASNIYTFLFIYMGASSTQYRSNSCTPPKRHLFT